MKFFFPTILMLSISVVSYPQTRSVSYTNRLSTILSTKGTSLSTFCNTTNDPIRNRVLFEYGSAFIAKGAILPENCLQSENQINSFRTSAKISDNCFAWGGSDSCLQREAKKSLEKVFSDPLIKEYKNLIRRCNDSVPCIDCVNSDWAFRGFGQAKTNWENGKSKPERSRHLAKLSDVGIISYSYTDKQQPLMFSNAIPGGSQHHLGLAIDVISTGMCRVGSDCEKALQKNGWFRTIKFDPNHFTFLGYTTEGELKRNGLKKVGCKDGFQYWVPFAPDYIEYGNWKCRTLP